MFSTGAGVYIVLPVANVNLVRGVVLLYVSYGLPDDLQPVEAVEAVLVLLRQLRRRQGQGPGLGGQRERLCHDV